MSSRDSQFCRCLYFAAGAFARKMNRLAEDAFASTGLAPSYAFMLMAVIRKPGISPSELSDELMLTPSTITRLMEKLEAKGLIERRVSGRTTEVTPTERSLPLEKPLKSAWKDLYTTYGALLGEANAQELTAALYEATKSIER